MKTDDQVSREFMVSLREINKDTVRAVCSLAVRPDQNRFVASVPVSIAQAYFEPKAWFRAIYADDTPVGFVMVYRDTDEPVYYLWRFLLDARFQRMGFGQQAMALLTDEVRTWPNAVEMLVSYVPDPDGPGLFYQQLGFEPTGEMEGIEEVARLTFV